MSIGPYGRTSIYRNARDIQTKEQLGKDFFVTWNLKETLLELADFRKTLAIKVKL